MSGNETRHRKYPGPRSKFIQQHWPVFLGALRVGCSRAVAAAYAGLDEATLHELMAHNPNFKQDTEQAEAEIEIRMVRTVTSCKPRSQAAKYWLEHWRPESWGPQQSVAAATEESQFVVEYDTPDGKPYSESQSTWPVSETRNSTAIDNDSEKD
jgi:hypothetical protein